MDEGFVVSDKTRKIILLEVVSGEEDLDRITKKRHLIPRMAERALSELIEGGYLEKRGGKVILTKMGEKAAEIIERNEKGGSE